MDDIFLLSTYVTAKYNTVLFTDNGLQLDIASYSNSIYMQPVFDKLMRLKCPIYSVYHIIYIFWRCTKSS